MERVGDDGACGGALIRWLPVGGKGVEPMSALIGHSSQWKGGVVGLLKSLFLIERHVIEPCTPAGSGTVGAVELFVI